MAKISIRDIGEFIAVVGVIFTLVFVGLELRENRIAARAAAYQEIGLAIAGNWIGRAHDRNLNDIVEKVATDAVDWSALTESDIHLARAYIIGVLRTYETVYTQVEQGLLDVDAMKSLGWDRFDGGPFLRNMWPYAEGFVSPQFADYLRDSGALTE